MYEELRDTLAVAGGKLLVSVLRDALEGKVRIATSLLLDLANLML